MLGVLAQRLVRRLCPHCRRSVPARPEQRLALDDANLLGTESVWEAVGCPRCEGTGYHGRTGIFELLLPDDALRELIAKGATEGELRTRSGLVPLLVDGLEKVRAGETTLDEVLRVGLR